MATTLFRAMSEGGPLAQKARILITYFLGLRPEVMAPYAQWAPKPPCAALPFSYSYDYGYYVAGDMLHWFLVGLCKHFHRVIFDKIGTDGWKVLSRNICVASRYFDDGVTTLDAFDNVSKIKDLALLTGRARESLTRILISALIDNVPMGGKTKHENDYLRLQARFCLISLLSILNIGRGVGGGAATTPELKRLHATVLFFMTQTMDAFPHQKSSWDFPKFHLLLHIVDLLMRFGSLSNTTMSAFERFHRWMKADGRHSNCSGTDGIAISLLRSAQTRLTCAAVEEIINPDGIKKLPLNDPKDECVQRFPRIRKVVNSSFLDVDLQAVAAWMPQPFRVYGELEHKLNYMGVKVADFILKVGHVVRCQPEISREMPLYVVRGFISDEFGDPIACVASSTRIQTKEDNDGIDEEYPENFLTHVRYHNADCHVFPALDIFNRIDDQRYLKSGPPGEERIAAIIPNAFVWNPTLERSRHKRRDAADISPPMPSFSEPSDAAT